MGKKILFIAFAGLLLSCSKESVESPVQGFSLEAGMPQVCTKTVLGAKSAGVYPVLWSSGDCIKVNGVESSPLSALAAGGSQATFQFSEGISAPYHVLYGAAPGRDDQVEIPSVQSYSAGNIRSNYAPMYAESNETSFTMKHLSCVLSLPLTGSVSVAGISLRSLDGTPIAGRIGLVRIGKIYTGKTDSSAGLAEVEMTVPSGGVSLSGGKVFCFALCPATLEKGLSIDVYTTAGARMNMVVLEGETLEAGNVYEVPSTAFSANAEPVTVISTYAQLKEFAALDFSAEPYHHARLVKDITVDGTWTPIEGFTGDFDGGGYTISGLQKAFANELRGCIRNLTVEGNITITGKDDIVGDESVFWAGILTNRIYTNGMVLNCRTKGSISYTQWGSKTLEVGALCGYAPRGKISGCVNEASVYAIGDGTAAVYAGGLFGRVYASSDVISIKNCRNDGTVSVGGSIKGCSVGGIVGHMDANHTSVLSGDVNTGDIVIEASSSVSAAMNVAGVAGYSKNEISACSNVGYIHQGASTSYDQNVGGIAGQVITGSVSECVNGGKVKLDGSSAGVVRCGGILGYAYNDAATTNIDVTACTFSGAVTVDIAAHSTLNVFAITGLYNIATHTETDCASTGTVTVK